MDLEQKILKIINEQIVLSKDDAPWRYAPEYAAKLISKEVANSYNDIQNVIQRYTIEDIERCVENWGLCKVEKEYIERFLNGG
jgi:hypothetical protein